MHCDVPLLILQLVDVYKRQAQGQPHVLQQIIDQLEDLFIGMGYEVAVGDEVEPVSYTHLDVYKRQGLIRPGAVRRVVTDSGWRSPNAWWRVTTER